MQLALDTTPGGDVSHYCRNHAHKHLEDLEYCYELCNNRGNSDIDSFEGIVRVHDSVDKVVDARKVKLQGTLCRPTKGVIGEKENSDMMIPMQETEFALPQDNEDRVSQLHQFGEAKYETPEDYAWVMREYRCIAGGVNEPVANDVVNEMGEHGNASEEGEHCQHDVPKEEGVFEVVGSPIRHPLSSKVKEY